MHLLCIIIINAVDIVIISVITIVIIISFFICLFI